MFRNNLFGMYRKMISSSKEQILKTQYSKKNQYFALMTIKPILYAYKIVRLNPSCVVILNADVKKVIRIALK
jgi:hypothetical protein